MIQHRGDSSTINHQDEFQSKETHLLQLLTSDGCQLKEKHDIRSLKVEGVSNQLSISELRVLAMGRNGLSNNLIRKLAWPRLVEITVIDDASELQHALPSLEEVKSNEFMSSYIPAHTIPPRLSDKEQEAHKDYHQVVMDVNRSLKRFPPGLDDVQRMSMHDQLVSLILRVLAVNPHLHYYQGYHDIAVTFLIVLDEDLAAAVLSKISQRHLKDYMATNMDPTVRLLQLIPALLQKEQPKLAQSLSDAEVQPFYALPWVITWFGHVLGDLSRILRLYDFFMAAHPLMPIYVSAAIVLHRQEELLQMAETPEGNDSAILHHFLSNLPPNLPLERLIRRSCILFRAYPPKELWKLVPGDDRIPGLVKQKAGPHRGIASKYQLPIPQNHILSRWLSTNTNISRSWLSVTLLVLAIATFLSFYWKSVPPSTSE